jgi:hypothetical protein
MRMSKRRGVASVGLTGLVVERTGQSTHRSQEPSAQDDTGAQQRGPPSLRSITK